MVRIDGVVFLHGGLTPEVAALGCEAINATVRREITSDIAKTRLEPQASLAAGDSGPFWYRGMAREDETAWLPSLERVLAGIGAQKVVIGHTVTGDGRIRARFGGRVVMIDVGMNPLYGRNLAALEIGADGSMSALYEGRREELALPKAAALAPSRQRRCEPLTAARRASRSPRATSRPSRPRITPSRRVPSAQPVDPHVAGARGPEERAGHVLDGARVAEDAGAAHQHATPLGALDHLQHVLVAGGPCERRVLLRRSQRATRACGGTRGSTGPAPRRPTRAPPGRSSR